MLVSFCGSTHSICYDFLVKITGKDHCRHDIIGRLPIIEGKYLDGIINRTLRLNCLTKYYSDLWGNVALPSIIEEMWTCDDPRLINRVVPE